MGVSRETPGDLSGLPRSCLSPCQAPIYCQQNLSASTWHRRQEAPLGMGVQGSEGTYKGQTPPWHLSTGRVWEKLLGWQDPEAGGLKEGKGLLKVAREESPTPHAPQDSLVTTGHPGVPPSAVFRGKPQSQTGPRTGPNSAGSRGWVGESLPLCHWSPGRPRG